MTAISTMLSAMSACKEAVEWAEPYATLAEGWAACERSDWMCWYLDHVGGYEDVLRAIAFDWAHRAVRVHAVAALESAADALERESIDATAVRDHIGRLRALEPIGSRDAARAASYAAWAASDAAGAASDAAWAARNAAGAASNAAGAASNAAWAASHSAGAASYATEATSYAAGAARNAARAAHDGAEATSYAAWAASDAALAASYATRAASNAALAASYATRAASNAAWAASHSAGAAERRMMCDRIRAVVPEPRTPNIAEAR